MDLSFKDPHWIIVRAESKSMLLLCTNFAKNGIDIEKIDRESFRFKREYLSRAIELLCENDSIEFNSYKQLFENHKLAIDSAKLIRESGLPTNIPDKWIDILDPPQAMAVAELVQSDSLGVCLFDEQGSGKTVMTIAAYDILKNSNEIDAMIVVCPKSMMSEWPKDINKFTFNAYITVVADGIVARRRESALSNFDIIIVGYEGLESIMQPLISKSTNRRYLLVADESFFVKNKDAQRSETINKLRNFCKKCFVLCGTPAPNSPYDLINQMNLADLGYAFGGFIKSKDVNADRDRISNLLEQRGSYIRRLKTEILDDVPEKYFHIYKVPLIGQQALMYENARFNLELELINLGNQKFKRSIASYLQKRAALLQICSCPDAIDPSYTEVPAKYLELDKIIETLFAKGRKLIVWSFYKKSIDALIERYEIHKPLRIDGSVGSSERKDAVNIFQNDPGRMLLIANPAAAGAGITLHASYDAAYFSYSNKAADYLQSLDRIHRRGQQSSQVNYYLFVCQNTIEENEIKRLRAKEVSQGQLLGDYSPWPTSFDQALAELKGHA